MSAQAAAGEWINSGGKDYFVRCWDTADAWARLVIVHGLGEHSGRYESLARTLAGHGISVVSFDQQGHGKDRRSRGCIDSYSAMLDDITNILTWAGAQQPTLPMVLLGHSMGGNLALNHALRIGSRSEEALYKAVISSSPMIRAQRAPGAVGEFLARTMMLVAPNHQLKSKVYPERLMSDPAEQESWQQDSVFHSRLSLRLGAALIDSGRWALENADTLSVPLLLSHGTVDELTVPTASEEFAEKSNEYCELKMWDGFLHDPFRCIGKEQVIEYWASFLRRHVERGSE